MFSTPKLLRKTSRVLRARYLTVALVGVLVAGVAPLVARREPVARAAHDPGVVHRPLPPNMVEAYAPDGRIVALAYRLSYYCPTTPASDLDGPFGHGDGHRQAVDPKEYQLPPCFAGDTGTGSVLPADLEAAAFPGVRPFYGILPNFGGSLYLANNPPADVDAHCSEPGLPATQHRGDPGTCLMHPSLVRVARAGDPAQQAPDPIPLPQHSHVIEVASSPPSWWHAVPVLVNDRSIWPDRDGRCPAGPPACLTSLAAIRAAQREGQVGPDIPTNAYFFFSVHPEAR